MLSQILGGSEVTKESEGGGEAARNADKGGRTLADSADEFGLAGAPDKGTVDDRGGTEAKNGRAEDGGRVGDRVCVSAVPASENTGE